MKFPCMLAAVLCWLALSSFPQASQGAGPDPYAPLALYQGSWKVRIGAPEKRPDDLTNHCSRTGTFFVCEQEVNGKSMALVIFLPTGKNAAGGLEYRTMAALPDASRPEEWGHLLIEGDTWTYTWSQREGEKTVAMRNVNHFKDKDHIHFELQKLEENVWKTQMSGDEERAK